VKEQYGSDPDSEEESETDSEDLESEDSDGEELTPAMDAAILRTLARIKQRDPAIYEEGKNIFGGTYAAFCHSVHSLIHSTLFRGARKDYPVCEGCFNAACGPDEGA
jgi:hypothetical protein